MPSLLTTLIRATPPSLPVGFCITSAQQFASAIINGTVFTFASDIGNIAYNYGDTLPSAENRIFPWFRTVNGGYPNGWWTFQAGVGAWLQEYPYPAGPNGLRMDWEDTEAALLIYDGGENAPASLTAGPFWEVDHAYDGRSSMGPGVILNASPAKTLAMGEDYGSGATLQSPDQVGAHDHPLAADASIVTNGQTIKVVNTGSGGPGLLIGGSGPASTDLSVLANEYTADQEQMPIVHPVRGSFKVRRSIRQYRRIDV